MVSSIKYRTTGIFIKYIEENSIDRSKQGGFNTITVDHEHSTNVPRAFEKSVPLPIKRVNRLINQMNDWADRWIGKENGQIGFYEKEMIKIINNES